MSYLSHRKPLIYIYIQKHINCKLSSKTWWIVVAMTIILFTFTFIHKYSSYHVCSYLFPFEQRGPFSFLLVIFLHLIDWWCNRSTKVREKKYFFVWKEQVLFKWIALSIDWIKFGEKKFMGGIKFIGIFCMQIFPFIILKMRFTQVFSTYSFQLNLHRFFIIQLKVRKFK